MAVGATSNSLQAEIFADQHARAQAGTLYEGVRSGQLNQQEFIALATRLNRNAEAAATTRTKPQGAVPGEGVSANQVPLFQAQATDMQAAQQTFQRIQDYAELQREFLEGDQHPATELRDGVDGRLHEQLIQIYNGIRNGSISREEAAALLGEQLSIGRLRGEQRSDGVVTGQEQANLDGRLNTAAANLEAQRTD